MSLLRAFHVAFIAALTLTTFRTVLAELLKLLCRT